MDGGVVARLIYFHDYRSSGLGFGYANWMTLARRFWRLA